MVSNRPNTKVVLAMSVDGKIADLSLSPARFGSKNDKAHLEKQVATSDAVIFGAGTLRAYGTTLRVSDSQLLHNRAKVNKPPQPLHIIITNSGNINPDIHFFNQPINRCLLTTSAGSLFWRQCQGKIRRDENIKFQQTLIFETPHQTVDIVAALKHLKDVGIENLAVLGGGKLIASMLELDLIDELWITVCPLILGGADTATPVEGIGFLEKNAPRLKLVNVEKIGEEVFLHYQVSRFAPIQN
ncbi:MAG: RibD family protein [Cyanobacteria bacterium P01_A01_bin.45]